MVIGTRKEGAISPICAEAFALSHAVTMAIQLSLEMIKIEVMTSVSSTHLLTFRKVVGR